MDKYRIIKERHGFALVVLSFKFEREGDTARATVVGIDRAKGQVYSAMPSDIPAEGGVWFGAISDTGIDYVAKLYTRGYARRVFRGLIRDPSPADYDALGLEDIDYDALVSAGADC